MSETVQCQTKCIRHFDKSALSLYIQTLIHKYIPYFFSAAAVRFKYQELIVSNSFHNNLHSEWIPFQLINHNPITVHNATITESLQVCIKHCSINIEEENM